MCCCVGLCMFVKCDWFCGVGWVFVDYYLNGKFVLI